MTQSIDLLARALFQSQRLAVITGGRALMPAVPSFRMPQGVQNADTGEVLTLSKQSFLDEPGPILRFLARVYGLSAETKETSLYAVLRRLHAMNRVQGFITANVDGQETKRLDAPALELLGSFTELVCTEYVHHRWPMSPAFLERMQRGEAVHCSHPDCTGLVKPNILLLGDTAHGLEKAVTILKGADTVLLLGVDLVGYPLDILLEYTQETALIVCVDSHFTGSYPSLLNIPGTVDENFARIPLR